MHDFLVGMVFVAMVMAPCVVALTVKLHGCGLEVAADGRSRSRIRCTSARRCAVVWHGGAGGWTMFLNEMSEACACGRCACCWRVVWLRWRRLRGRRIRAW